MLSRYKLQYLLPQQIPAPQEDLLRLFIRYSHCEWTSNLYSWEEDYSINIFIRMEILKRLQQFSMFRKMSFLILSMKNLYYIIINYFAQYIILSSGS